VGRNFLDRVSVTIRVAVSWKIYAQTSDRVMGPSCESLFDGGRHVWINNFDDSVVGKICFRDPSEQLRVHVIVRWPYLDVLVFASCEEAGICRRFFPSLWLQLSLCAIIDCREGFVNHVEARFTPDQPNGIGF